MEKETQEQIELTGIAYNRKGGAVVDVDGTHYWIEGLDSWEDRINEQKVKVSGVLATRADNPVIPDTLSEIAQGIPTPPDQLEANRNRYWVLNASWELVQ